MHCACCPCPHTTTSTALPLLSSIRHEGFGGRLRNAVHAGHTHIFLLLVSVLFLGFAPAGLGWLGLSRVRSRCMRPSLSPCLLLRGCSVLDFSLFCLLFGFGSLVGCLLFEVASKLRSGIGFEYNMNRGGALLGTSSPGSCLYAMNSGLEVLGPLDEALWLRKADVCSGFGASLLAWPSLA